MKSNFPVVALTLLFLSVVALSTVRVDPVHAACDTDNMTLDDMNVETQPSGEFSYELFIKDWELTFDPYLVWIDLEPDTTVGIDEDSVIWGPSSYNLLLNCEYVGSDPWDYIFTIEGDVLAQCPTGGANITMKARIVGFGDHHDEYWPTTIPCP